MSGRVYFGWYVAGAAFLLALCGWGFGFYGPGIYLAALQARHGWSTAAIASAITFYYLAGAVLVGFLAGAIERFGPRPVVTAGSLCMALGVCVLAGAGALWQVYAGFLAMAFGWAAMSAAAVNLLVAPWFDRRRGLAISLALNGASCGGVVVAPLLVLLIGRLGFAAALPVAAAVMLAVLLPVVWLCLRDPAGRADDAPAIRSGGARPAGPWVASAVLRQRNFLTVTLPFSLGLTAQVGFLTHQVAFLTQSLSIEAAGLAVGLTTAAAVAGRLATGTFVDRIDRRLVASLNFLLQVAALAILLLGHGAAALFAGCILYGLGVGNVVSLPGLIVQQEFPAEHFGRVVGLVIAVNQFVYAFGPAILGALQAWRGSYAAALLLCLLLDLAAAVLVLFRGPAPAPAGPFSRAP